jgi:hypothetical protein
MNQKKKALPFKAGDKVRPRREWRQDPNRIPTGVIRQRIAWGGGFVYYVGTEQRAFAGYVFEKIRKRKKHP